MNPITFISVILEKTCRHLHMWQATPCYPDSVEAENVSHPYADSLDTSALCQVMGKDHDDGNIRLFEQASWVPTGRL